MRSFWLASFSYLNTFKTIKTPVCLFGTESSVGDSQNPRAQEAKAGLWVQGYLDYKGETVSKTNKYHDNVNLARTTGSGV